jgi:periplasmic protein TonB
MISAVIPARLTARATPGDRLGLTLCLAAVAHAILILGVSFGSNAGRSASARSLEVILVQQAADQAPEEADYIAQVDAQASGAAASKARPTSPLPGPVPAATAGQAPIASDATQAAQAASEERMLLTQQHAEHQVHNAQQTAEEAANTGQSQLQVHLELARLTSELAEDVQQYAQSPRINYLESVGAKSALEAAYIKHWVDQVERVGNLNYPDEARRRKLSGQLILHVLLDSEGHIVEAFIGSPSGQQVLDDAALRIVELAAPFAPFPAPMREAYDQLMITRTWAFEAEGGLTTH